MGAEHHHQFGGARLHRPKSAPQKKGSSFTALLELPANKAMELLVHPAEEAAAITENPQVAFSAPCAPPPPRLFFPADAALVGRAAKFSLLVNPDKKSPANSGSTKPVPAECDSTSPNSNSSPSKPKSSTKRKGREEKGKESIRKCKKAAEEEPQEAAKKLPYVHVRARRGQATDSHSLAERARREKINAKMKLLQELVPGCNKISGTALVLEEIINHVQSLQRQVEILSMRLAAVNPRRDFNFDSLMVVEDGSTLDGNSPSMVMPSTWHDGQMHKNILQYQQFWHLNEHHQPIWGREDDHPKFV